MSAVTPKFFGQYLLEKGILSKDQLIDAINYQKSKILKLGEIAVNCGYITPAQADKINTEQQRTDMRFGDLAINMGFLNEKQVEEIFTIQKNNHIYLGEAIVACGHLDAATADAELALFKKEQEAVPPINVQIVENIPEKQLIEVAADLTEKIMRRVGDLMSKSGSIVQSAPEINNLGAASILVFEGEIDARYILNLSWEVGHQIAKRIFKKDTLGFDRDLIVDTASEFVNVVCGNVRSKMLELGKPLEIIPPQSFSEDGSPALTIDEGETATIIPYNTPIGNFEIIILTKD